MRLTIAAAILLSAVVISAQKPLPVIDMHLHASTAAANGPPPLALCVPVAELPTWDPKTPWPTDFHRVAEEAGVREPGMVAGH